MVGGTSKAVCEWSESCRWKNETQAPHRALPTFQAPHRLASLTGACEPVRRLGFVKNALMIFKSLNGLVPEYPTAKFIKRNESSHSLRDSVNKLVVPFPRTNYMNTFSYSGATLYYSLTCNIRESGSLKAKTCKRTGLNWEITSFIWQRFNNGPIKTNN